ncbi:Gfo/Idh/MocA family oxidoreductase [Cohnella faecalis]|uniref:Gfo/Idh/MocA family oxidoreductase n=1 Tax=Cohnella faecalis TaxID=2315694 RepID=UPI003988A835
MLLKDPYYEEIAHFLECFASGKEPIVSALDALEAIRWAEAALESARTGLPVNHARRETRHDQLRIGMISFAHSHATITWIFYRTCSGRGGGYLR